MITRREAVRFGGLMVFAATVTGTIACSKKSVLDWAGVARAFLEQSVPYFTNLIPTSVPGLAKAIAAVRDLEAALKANSPNSVDLIRELISPDGLFQHLLTDAGDITDPRQREIVSGILAMAGVALNLINAALQQGSGDAPPAAVAEAKKRSKGTLEKVAGAGTLEKALAALKL